MAKVWIEVQDAAFWHQDQELMRANGLPEASYAGAHHEVDESVVAWCEARGFPVKVTKSKPKAVADAEAEADRQAKETAEAEAKASGAKSKKE